MYDASIARWTTQDPLSESYYSYSPFHFLGNNPIRFLDLNGMNYNDYKLNQDGSIKLDKITDSKTDELYATKSDGTIDKSKAVSVTKGIFTNPVRDTKGAKTIGFKTDNVEDAKKVFKFASDNSTSSSGNSMEFGIITFQKEGLDQAVVMTDGNANSVGATKQAGELKKGGAKISDITHNHPNGTRPSGYTKQGQPDGQNIGDFRNIGFVNSDGSQIDRHVYSSQTNTGKNLLIII